MDTESLFWALSTLPQVNAALIAFVGFLVQDSLSKIDARCAVIEDLIKNTSDNALRRFLLGLNKNDTRGLALRTMDGGKMMKGLLAEIDRGTNIFEFGGHLQADIDIWRPLNQWREETRRRLRIFLIVNISVLSLSLVLLPFSKFLEPYAAVTGTGWFLIASLAMLSTATMAYQILWRPRP